MEVREPTLENKRLIESKGLVAERWLVIWEDNKILEIISKRSKQRRVLVK